MNQSRPVWSAVLPSAPKEYDQYYMGRLVDIVNKLVEQLVEPRQLTAASAVFSDLPQESPRHDTEGEVFTKVCGSCGCTVLAINQTVPEVLQHHAQRRRFRTGSGPQGAGDLGDAGGQPAEARNGKGESGGS